MATPRSRPDAGRTASRGCAGQTRVGLDQALLKEASPRCEPAHLEPGYELRPRRLLQRRQRAARRLLHVLIVIQHPRQQTLRQGLGHWEAPCQASMQDGVAYYTTPWQWLCRRPTPLTCSLARTQQTLHRCLSSSWVHRAFRFDHRTMVRPHSAPSQVNALTMRRRARSAGPGLGSSTLPLCREADYNRLPCARSLGVRQACLRTAGALLMIASR